MEVPEPRPQLLSLLEGWPLTNPYWTTHVHTGGGIEAEEGQTGLDVRTQQRAVWRGNSEESWVATVWFRRSRPSLVLLDALDHVIILCGRGVSGGRWRESLNQSFPEPGILSTCGFVTNARSQHPRPRPMESLATLQQYCWEFYLHSAQAWGHGCLDGRMTPTLTTSSNPGTLFLPGHV